MAFVEIRDDTIWANHIEGGKLLKDRIISLAPGEVIELEVKVERLAVDVVGDRVGRVAEGDQLR